MKQNQGPRKVVGDYEIHMDKRLGQGMSGTVYQAYDTVRNEQVAIKMIQKSNGISDEQNVLNDFKKEYSIVTKISSENVVGFKDIIATKNYFYIVQEKCDHDLRKFINQNPNGFSQKQAVEMMAQILQGFYALIIANVIHRDIKPENILFKNGKLKIADFGLSKRARSNQTLVSAVGTRIYSSPQIILNTEYTAKCDIWAFGAIFYELLFGKKLLGVSGSKILLEMKQIEKGFDFPLKPEVTQQCKECIRACLRFEEQDRADWEFIFNHSLFLGKVPCLQKLSQQLNLIISIIDQNMEEKNLDQEKFFKSFGVLKGEELDFENYHKIIVKLAGLEKVSPQSEKFSFNYFDKDKNGRISLQQFSQTLQQFSQSIKQKTNDQTLKIFKSKVSTTHKAQDNHSEKFTEKQFQFQKRIEKAYKKMLGQLKEKDIDDLQAKFEIADKSSKGITFQEFKDFSAQLLELQMSQQEYRLVFNKFDEDRNGLLNFKQFQKYICKEIKGPDCDLLTSQTLLN